MNQRKHCKRQPKPKDADLPQELIDFFLTGESPAQGMRTPGKSLYFELRFCSMEKDAFFQYYLKHRERIVKLAGRKKPYAESYFKRNFDNAAESPAGCRRK